MAHMLQIICFLILFCFYYSNFPPIISKWSKLFPWAVLAIRGHLYSNDRPAVAILKQLQLLFNYSRCLRRTKRIASVEWPNYIRTALDWVFNTVSFSMGVRGNFGESIIIYCYLQKVLNYLLSLLFIIYHCLQKGLEWPQETPAWYVPVVIVPGEHPQSIIHNLSFIFDILCLIFHLWYLSRTMFICSHLTWKWLHLTIELHTYLMLLVGNFCNLQQTFQ